MFAGYSHVTTRSVVNIHPNTGGYVIAMGAVLGICAGLLWTAQGSLMLAYPTESQKGRFIGIFWSMFNLGGVVGASVSLGQNFHSTVRVHQADIWAVIYLSARRQTELEMAPM